MAYTFYRIFNSPLKRNKKRVLKGRKKKARRIHRADTCDGWSRKRAGRLSPAFRPSKDILRSREVEQEVLDALDNPSERKGGQWHGQVKIREDFDVMPDDFMEHYE